VHAAFLGPGKSLSSADQLWQGELGLVLGVHDVGGLQIERLSIERHVRILFLKVRLHQILVVDGNAGLAIAAAFPKGDLENALPLDISVQVSISDSKQ